MKNFIKYAVLMLALTLTPMMWSCDDDDDDFSEELISFDQLPSESRSFINMFYPNAAVIKAEREFDDGEILYEVDLSNGHEVTFASDGSWLQVDAPDGMSIPFDILPVGIQDYLDAYFSGYGVNDITKTGYGYEVELTTGLDLMFDWAGDFIGTDD